jgi:ABC-type multidrug transport system fused ATPase/permease subunit
MKELTHYIKQLYSYSGKILYLNLLGLVFASLLDGAAILVLIPMLSISGILNISNNTSSIWEFLDVLSNFPSQVELPFILGVFIVLTIGQNLLQRNISIRDVRIQQGFMNQLKEDIYQSLLNVKWEFYIKNRKTDIINSLTKDMIRVGMGIKVLMQLVTSLVFTLIQIGIAFWLSPEISSIVVVCGIGLAFFSWRFVKQSKKVGNDGTQIAREYLAGMTDNLNAMKDIKTNTLETSRIHWLQSLNNRMLHEQVNFVKIQTNSQLSYKTALALILTCFLMLSVTLFHTQPGNLLMVIIIFGRLWPRFVTIQSNLQQLALTIPSFKILLDLQNETNGSREIGNEMIGDIELIRIEKAIECRNVSFRYNMENSTYALRDISLQIPANCMTAIVGQSGAGKSTLVDILMGLNRPESGKLLIDGIPLEERHLLALRKNISFVPQDPFLFNSSIRENLLLLMPDATEEQLWEALEFAVADDFVKRLPEGLDTPIGDRGVRLSGGERQRLVLARAILRKPALLVLDEATSALDTENEAKIQKALEQLKGKMTIIIIAHRLSTIRNSDQVIVLDKGRIVQNGEYGQLSEEEEGMFSRFLDRKLEGSM